ncbi:hypothetical protein HBI56_036960 [Parastagonospora nodorum]|uniref:Uncharacterized protein n=2 Tax=Phaeosphaeria nodorum (strain SN15 / ATCC MYA-4574 / FGSC 10173) TaxID=321614 RepID=A0A7U2EXE2_PHANO|nr:hypothetical protein SNOG_03819 [Parastagonospora nodorum SN15]KAH3916177.1 hypothetical protein HBH56_069840 [Parastagonospora nodorum]EAT89024.1 hypothetical protein SNOG_03819 [Parastagonospora nodorum SN15]KAH3932715.1 hypothetical protein HBH54_078280 [Parastagonospora nodorum]KAH3955198.1 hypothetical protein HBH53_016080 [Parastagonospora nodorum]KAH3986263.1 hypothetical protein HBH52_047240 [Parastagonospora nodorum]
MAAAPSNTASNAVSIPAVGVSEFRLGEDENSDLSDSDQSEHSERSLSPESGAKPSKAKKRKARKQVGALTDELDTLLGAAFQAPNGDAVKSDVPGNIDHASGDLSMEVDTEKRLPKRTRQNMIKMEKRKLARERQKQNQPFQQPAPAQKPLTAEGQKKQQKQSKKNSGQARRERKEKARARRALGLGEEMAVD